MNFTTVCRIPNLKATNSKTSTCTVGIVCRACATEFGEGYQGIYLFEGRTNILDIFTKCTALEIDITDNLPAYICERCHTNMEKFYEFRVKCEDSDSYFRQKLMSSSLGAIEDYSKIEEVQDREESDKELESEQRPTENSDRFDCEICGTLESHLRNHCGLKSLEKSNRSTDHKEALIQNVENVSRRDNSKSNLKSDSEIVERGRKYSCVHCGKTYKKKESLDGHIREHRGLDPFECKLCGTTFQKLRSLVLHNDAKHNEDFQKIPCNYDGCDKTFTTKFGLKEHISNIHLGIKKARTQSQISYVCELCGKFFKNKTSLKKHSYFHSGERPFACSYCPKRFTVKDKLKNHIMRHENVKNFECSYCGMRKVTMAELKIHMNSHTMDKVYPCPQCPAVFSRDGNAKRHFRIVHRGYKPYKCTTCSQSFSKKETLKHHEMTHSGEKPHACNLCDKRFIQPIALKKHLKVHSKYASRMAASTQFGGIPSAITIFNSLNAMTSYEDKVCQESTK